MNEERFGGLDRTAKIVLIALALNTFMSMLDQSIVATAGPAVVGSLGGLDYYAWMFTAYMLAFSVVMPIYGKLGDLFGRKPVHLFAITVFLAGSAACGLAQDMPQLIAFRVLQGIGGGGLVVLGMGTLGDLLEPWQRARYQGYFAAVFTLANLSGPVIGGVLADTLGWRWVFFINLPIGLLTFGLLAVFLRRTRTAGPVRIDYAGAATLSVAIVAALLAATWGGVRYAWTSPPILALATAVVVLLVIWVLIERAAAEPLLPLRLFRDSTFTLSGLIAFAGSFAFFGAITFIPLFMQLVSGVSATETGLLYLPAMVCVAVASVVAGRVIGRTGRYKWFPVASMAAATLGMALLSTIGAGTPTVVPAIYLAVVGFGIGLSQQVTTLVAQNAAPQRDMGVATSTIGLMRNLAVPLGTAVFATVLNARLASDFLEAGLDARSLTRDSVAALPEALRTAVVDAYAFALGGVFRTAVPVLIIGLLCALLLKDVPLERRRGGPGVRPEPEPERAHS